MYKMDTRCTNKQAEAFAILKALEYVQTDLENGVDKITRVYTESRTTLESLHNMNQHTFLTEEIRRKCKRWESGVGQTDAGGQKPMWEPLVTN